MPQMMPINWLMSFFLFVLIFIMFNMMNYYIFDLKIKYPMKNYSPLKKNFFWKW